MGRSMGIVAMGKWVCCIGFSMCTCQRGHHGGDDWEYSGWGAKCPHSEQPLSYTLEGGGLPQLWLGHSIKEQHIQKDVNVTSCCQWCSLEPDCGHYPEEVKKLPKSRIPGKKIVVVLINAMKKHCALGLYDNIILSLYCLYLNNCNENILNTQSIY